MTIKKISMSVLLGLQLVGCAQMSRLNTPINEKISNQEKQADEQLANIRSAQKPKYVTESNVPFISKKAVSQTSVETLPPSFKELVTVNETFTNMAAVADYVYWKFGIPVFIDKKVSSTETKSTASVNPQFSASATASRASMNSAGNSELNALSINYKSGSLKGLLDTIADKQGISWKYENNTIKFFLTETKYFVFTMSPLKKKMSDNLAQSGTITSSTGGGNVGGSSKQSISADYTIDNIKPLLDTVQKMLSKDGSVLYNEATSTLSVTDTPNVLTEVGKYVELQQKIATKTAIVSIKTYEVSVSDLDSMGIDANLMYANADRGYAWKNTGNDADSAVGGLFGAVVTSATSKWKGSNVSLNALAQQGKVNVLRSLSTRLFNNEPAHLILGEETNYLKSVENTTGSNSSSTQSKLEPGTVETGYSMKVHANIGLDNSMIINVSLFTGDLVGKKFDSYTSNGSSIQLPKVSKFQIQQTVPAKSGQSVVLLGFESDKEGIDKAGTLHPDNVLFGGNSNLNKDRKVLIVELTPVVLN